MGGKKETINENAKINYQIKTKWNGNKWPSKSETKTIK